MRAAGAAPLILGTLAVATGATFLWNVGALPGMASRNIASYLLGLLLGWGAHHLAHRRFGAEALFAAASLLFLLVLVAGTGCKSSSGSREYIPGEGWVPND